MNSQQEKDSSGVPPGQGWTAAVVADLGADTAGVESAREVAELAEAAAQIGELSGVRTVPLMLRCPDAVELMQALWGLPLQVGAVYLVGAGRERLREAQSLLADVSGRPVITEADAEAISVVGAVLTYLGRRQRHPSDCRVVLVGSSRLPMLCPLLLSAGVFHLTMWDHQDAAVVPLWRVARDADVVVDLSGSSEAVRQVALDRPCDSVIAPPAEAAGMLPVPGLIRAVAAAVGPVVDVEVYRACAIGLVNAAPPRGLSPVLSSPNLVHAVASAAGRAMGPTAGAPPRPPGRPPGWMASFWRHPSSRPELNEPPHTSTSRRQGGHGP